MDGVPERWVGIEQVIEHTRLSRATIYRLLQGSDGIPSIKIGRHRMFKLSKVDAYLERQVDFYGSTHRADRVRTQREILLHTVYRVLMDSLRHELAAPLEALRDMIESHGFDGYIRWREQFVDAVQRAQQRFGTPESVQAQQRALEAASGRLPRALGE